MATIEEGDICLPHYSDEEYSWVEEQVRPYIDKQLVIPWELISSMMADSAKQNPKIHPRSSTSLRKHYKTVARQEGMKAALATINQINETNATSNSQVAKNSVNKVYQIYKVYRLPKGGKRKRQEQKSAPKKVRRDEDLASPKVPNASAPLAADVLQYQPQDNRRGAADAVITMISRLYKEVYEDNDRQYAATKQEMKQFLDHFICDTDWLACISASENIQYWMSQVTSRHWRNGAYPHLSVELFRILISHNFDGCNSLALVREFDLTLPSFVPACFLVARKIGGEAAMDARSVAPYICAKIDTPELMTPSVAQPTVSVVGVSLSAASASANVSASGVDASHETVSSAAADPAAPTTAAAPRTAAVPATAPAATVSATVSAATVPVATVAISKEVVDGATVSREVSSDVTVSGSSPPTLINLRLVILTENTKARVLFPFQGNTLCELQ